MRVEVEVEREDDADALALAVHGDRLLPLPTVRRPPVSAMLLVLLVVIGAGFRLWALGVHRLNFDESFTAIAGRMPLVRMFGYLRTNDSHPPLDYLLHAPFARAGVSELVLRLPAALCSIASLALFAWWVRGRGMAGLVATGLMALSAFQITHGREARMYAEMELVGVAVAVLAERWLRRPRRSHPYALALLVLAGLLTHVSMFLLGSGLLLLPGRRTDTDAWRWRGAILAGGAGWALLWAPTFWTQAHGGHTAWLPRTSLDGLAAAVARLVTPATSVRLAALALVAIGAVILARRDRRLGRVWTCCFAISIAVGAIAGLFAPVVLDRTFTVVAWAPLLALGYLVDELAHRWWPIAFAATAAAAIVMVPAAAHAVTVRSGPDTVLRRLTKDARAGDTVAVNPAWRRPELDWSLGVRGRLPTSPATTGLPGTAALVLRGGRPTGRVWLLDWRPRRPRTGAYRSCAPQWTSGRSRILCLVDAPARPPRTG